MGTWVTASMVAVVSFDRGAGSGGRGSGGRGVDLGDPRGRAGSAARGERAQEERQVGRALREPPHEVPIPVCSIRDVNPHTVPFGDQPTLLGLANPVEHLELVLVRLAADAAGQ